MPRTCSRLASAILLSLASVAVFAALMVRTQTAIPMPRLDESTPLSKLAYKPRRFEAAVTSLTVKMQSGAEADPVLTEWIFTGSNNDGQVHRVDVQITLVDENGKRVGWANAKYPLAAGSNGATFTVKMKANSAAWSAAKTVRIVADWVS